MNVTTIDFDTAFELIALEEMLALPAIDADKTAFMYGYKY